MNYRYVRTNRTTHWICLFSRISRSSLFYVWTAVNIRMHCAYSSYHFQRSFVSWRGLTSEQTCIHSFRGNWYSYLYSFFISLFLECFLWATEGQSSANVLSNGRQFSVITISTIRTKNFSSRRFLPQSCTAIFSPVYDLHRSFWSCWQRLMY